MVMISIPDAPIALMAVSLPEPGPLTKSLACLIPISCAFLQAVWAATWAAKAVPFLVPLKPDDPPDAQERTSPPLSVTVTIVLL